MPLFDRSVSWLAPGTPRVLTTASLRLMLALLFDSSETDPATIGVVVIGCAQAACFARA